MPEKSREELIAENVNLRKKLEECKKTYDKLFVLAIVMTAAPKILTLERIKSMARDYRSRLIKVLSIDDRALFLKNAEEYEKELKKNRELGIIEDFELNEDDFET